MDKRRVADFEHFGLNRPIATNAKKILRRDISGGQLGRPPEPPRQWAPPASVVAVGLRES